jgi:hypothetical protein
LRRIRGLSHPQLGPLDALLERLSLRGGELGLACLGFSEELESALEFLIREVIQAIAEQVAWPSRRGH